MLTANKAIVYFDKDLNEMDGCGWCVEVGDSFTFRYPNIEEALNSVRECAEWMEQKV